MGYAIWQVPELTLRWTEPSNDQAEGDRQADTGHAQRLANDTEPRGHHGGSSGRAFPGVEPVAGRERQLQAVPTLQHQPGKAAGFDAKLSAAEARGLAASHGQRSQVVPLFGGGVFDSGYNAGRAPKRVPLPAGAARVLLVSVITGT